MVDKELKQHIKTKCGLETYRKLKKRKGLLVQVRLLWFIIFATLRDLNKKSEFDKVAVLTGSADENPELLGKSKRV